LLRKRIGHLSAHNHDASGNSKFTGRPISLEYVEVWENFMGNGEIQEMLSNDTIKEVLFTPFTEEQLEHLRWTDPVTGGKIS
jgi:hypothetical protein